MRLAVLPARGGSKRIPRNNIQPFGAWPMIYGSIRAGIDSECFDRITVANKVQMFQQDNFDKRSQDLEPAFHDAGQFYWGQADAWLSGKCLFSETSVPVMLPRHRVHDLDVLEDWKEAEIFFHFLQIRRGKK